MATFLPGAWARGEDWPQWRGVHRDGKGPETHLARQWPKGGPPLLWTFDGLGQGYSSAVVSGGTVYATGMIDANGYLFALGLDGQLKWKTLYGPEWNEGYKGARTTPTVDGGYVYLYSTRGLLVCLDARSGSPVWQLDTVKEFGAHKVLHGICESVAVVGDLVICSPGGPGACVVGVDKQTGKGGWQTAGVDEKSAYCSPLAIHRGGKDLVAVIMAGSLLGIDAASGQVLWRHVYDSKAGQWPCAIPTYYDGIVYAPVGKEVTARAFTLSEDGNSIAPLWEQSRMPVHHGGVVAVDGCIYGTPNEAGFTCLDGNTGEVLWQSPKEKSLGAVVWSDGMFYLCMDNGLMRLVRASRQGYEFVSEFQLPGREKDIVWAHPTISDRRLYIRRRGLLLAYDISAALDTTH